MSYQASTLVMLKFFLVCFALALVGSVSVSAQGFPSILPANPWEAENLFVIVKDSESVFITANQNYVDSLTPSFPDIQQPEDLLGKTDFDFYPFEDAVKYQADDRNVIESGEGYETIEENQIGEGERNFVFVSKEPLFDSQNGVVGIVVRFYGIPEIGQTEIAAPRNRRQSETVIVTDKNAQGIYLNANQLFIDTFQEQFPYLNSVLNLVGRNDYCFYPVDVAEGILEDDRYVAETGKPLNSIEIDYVPGGRPGTAYHVVRKPLLDANRQVIGVRTTIWPVGNQTVKPGKQR